MPSWHGQYSINLEDAHPFDLSPLQTSDPGNQCSGTCENFCYQPCGNGDKCYTPTDGTASCVYPLGTGLTQCMQTCNDPSYVLASPLLINLSELDFTLSSCASSQVVLSGDTGDAYCGDASPTPSQASRMRAARKRSWDRINFEKHVF